MNTLIEQLYQENIKFAVIEYNTIFFGLSQKNLFMIIHEEDIHKISRKSLFRKNKTHSIREHDLTAKERRWFMNNFRMFCKQLDNKHGIVYCINDNNFLDNSE